MLIEKNVKGNEDYMTKEEIKEYLGIGDCCLRSLFLRPNFPVVELGRGKKVVRKSELIRYLDSFCKSM